MSYKWLEKDIVELKKLVAEGKSKEYLANHFNRTTTAIEIKVNRLGLQLLRPNRNWLKQELIDFALDWKDGSISKSVLIKKYNRSFFSLRKKALELNLGARPHNDEFLSISEICDEMQVSHDRVSNWIKIGLPTKKNRSGKTRYLIDVDDLLCFLEKHQDMFNASLISEYLFYDEPDWLKDKRKSDRESFPINLRSEYSNNDDIFMIQLFKAGKSDKYIADSLGRTESAIRDRSRLLGYTRGRYNDYEIDILKENSDYLTVSELAKLLPIRTEKGIMYKCEQLHIPYHVSKEMCKSVR